MPSIHERAIRVRPAECDIHGVMRDANYLRYMETATVEASTTVGYDHARYRVMGRIWLVREILLDLHNPLRLNEVVVVKTWVADLRRVRSRRAYLLRRPGTGELIATAYTDWAFLDAASGRPAVIPAEMIAAFVPEGLNDQPQPRPRFATAEPPPTAFTIERLVEWRDLDSGGHVNNATYLDYVEEAARQHLAACGWPTARLAAAGVALAARQHHIEYRLPALPDQRLRVTTWLVAGDTALATRHTTVRRAADDALLAQARTVWHCVEPTTRAPVPIPAALFEALTSIPSSAQQRA